MRKALTIAVAGATITGGLLSVAATANAATVVAHKPKASTALSVHVSALTGKRDKVTGTLMEGKKALAGDVVSLDVVSKGRMVAVAKAKTSRSGAVSFTVAPKGTTTYTLVFGGSSALAASHSGTVTVRVK